MSHNCWQRVPIKYGLEINERQWAGKRTCFHLFMAGWLMHFACLISCIDEDNLIW
jgi:hypothetical protein